MRVVPDPNLIGLVQILLRPPIMRDLPMYNGNAINSLNERNGHT